MSINRVNISGNLTRVPELRTTQGGTSVLTFGMAVNDRRRNQQTGEWEDSPNFIDCVLFGNRAEALHKLLDKGSKVAVEGKLRWSQWDSNGQKRSKIEVIAEEVEIMSQSKAQGQPRQQQVDTYHSQAQSATYSTPQQPTGYGYEDSDIHF